MKDVQRKKVHFTVSLAIKRNLFTPGHPGARVRNVRGRSCPENLSFITLKRSCAAKSRERRIFFKDLRVKLMIFAKKKTKISISEVLL